MSQSERRAGKIRIIGLIFITALVVGGVKLYDVHKDDKLVTSPTVALAQQEVPQVSTAQETPVVEVELVSPTETLPETVVDIVEANPQNCNKDTQWVWQDGSCHDKEVVTPVSSPTPVSAPVQTGVSDCDSLRSKMVALGIGADEIDAAVTLGLRESSCNEFVRNSIGACGYYQSLPCGKWGEPGSDTYLPGAIGYVRARYGNYNVALAHSYAHNWY